MKTTRMIIGVLLAIVLVGCVTQADSYSGQNPFNKPETMSGYGDGPATPDPSRKQTPTPMPTATPAPPASAPTLTAQQTDADEATISWNTVDDATGYQLQRQDGNDPWAPVFGIVTQTDTSVTHGLYPGKTYNYRVRAVNDAGEGPWSDVLPVTLSAPTATPSN